MYDCNNFFHSENFLMRGFLTGLEFFYINFLLFSVSINYGLCL